METDVRVGCKVNEEEVDYELDNLDSRDPFFPPDSDATGGLEVVPVHDDMDGQIERDWHVTLSINHIKRKKSYHRGVSDQLGEAENGSGSMMINVEKL